MFDKTIVIVTPWFGAFAGGAEYLARGMAREFNRRGIRTIVFTTCSLSPYDSWWEDRHAPGVYDVEGVETRRFATDKVSLPYHEVIEKLENRSELTAENEKNFYQYGINSHELVEALAGIVDGDYEILALPYFHGLTYSVLNKYPGKISLIPCFHDEPQFYWSTTEDMLRHARHIFYNSVEEKTMTTRRYGHTIGRSVVEGVVTGVGVELASDHNGSGWDQLELPADYFVYVGRKDRGKNVARMCEWFLSYKQIFRSEARLVILGGGDSSLVPANESIVDLDFVSETTKQRVIGGAKALINLSENESFSIVIMEGWLLGVPAVVSARSAAMKGHVRRCNGGLYVENEDEFAAALDFLERNDAIRRKLAANGQAYVAQNFSYDLVLASYCESFTASVDESRAMAAEANADVVC